MSRFCILCFSHAPSHARQKKAPEGECSEELISAIVNMCHIVGGPASGITREEAVAAATFKDELHTYKCAPPCVLTTGCFAAVSNAFECFYIGRRPCHPQGRAARLQMRLVESYRRFDCIIMPHSLGITAGHRSGS